MGKKNFRSIFRWVGRKFSNSTVLGIAGAIMAYLRGFVTGFSVYDPLAFAISILFCAAIGVVVSKLISNMMFLASKQIDCMEVQEKYETHRLLYLNVKNGYDQDINDFKVSVRKVSMINFPASFDVPQEGLECNVIKGIVGNRLVARNTAKTYIAQIPPGDENYIYTELLVKDRWLNDAMFELKNGVDDNTEIRIATYEVAFEISGKVEDELISRWYQAVFQYILSEKKNRGKISERYVTLDWKKFEKLHPKKIKQIEEEIETIDKEKIILTVSSLKNRRGNGS